MPYIFIYVQHYLKFDLNTFQITTPIIIGGAAAVVGLVVVTILLGKLLDKVGKRIFVFPQFFSSSRDSLPFSLQRLFSLSYSLRSL